MAPKRVAGRLEMAHPPSGGAPSFAKRTMRLGHFVTCARASTLLRPLSSTLAITARRDSDHIQPGAIRIASLRGQKAFAAPLFPLAGGKTGVGWIAFESGEGSLHNHYSEVSVKRALLVGILLLLSAFAAVGFGQTITLGFTVSRTGALNVDSPGTIPRVRTLARHGECCRRDQSRAARATKFSLPATTMNPTPSACSSFIPA